MKQTTLLTAILILNSFSSMEAHAQAVLLTVNDDFTFDSTIDASNYSGNFSIESPKGPIAIGIYLYDLNSGGGINEDENYYRFSLIHNDTSIDAAVGGLEILTGDPAFDVYKYISNLNGVTITESPGNAIYSSYVSGTVVPEPSSYVLWLGIVSLIVVASTRKQKRPNKSVQTIRASSAVALVSPLAFA